MRDRTTEFESLVKEFIPRKGIDSLMAWIRETDFFIAPASTQFHSHEVGGLCTHSINVFRRMVQRRSAEGFYAVVPGESCAIVGLFHDVCKANYYRLEMRDRKVDGKWSKVPVYQVHETFPLGHGEKSLYLISKHLELTDDEAMAIRWHMGPWGVTDTRDLTNAMERSRLVLLTQLADLEATYIDERGW